MLFINKAAFDSWSKQHYYKTWRFSKLPGAWYIYLVPISSGDFKASKWYFWDKIWLFSSKSSKCTVIKIPACMKRWVKRDGPKSKATLHKKQLIVCLHLRGMKVLFWKKNFKKIVPWFLNFDFWVTKFDNEFQ